MARKYSPVKPKIQEHMRKVRESLAWSIQQVSDGGMQQFRDSADVAPHIAGRTDEQVIAGMEQDLVDCRLALYCLIDAKTFIVDSDVAVALSSAYGKLDEHDEFDAPFESMIIQFAPPLKEREFFAIQHDHPAGSDDNIIAIILHLDSPSGLYDAIAYFSSGEVNRVRWRKGESPLNFVSDGRDDISVDQGNKHRIMAMCIAFVHYLNCENTQTEKISTPAKVAWKRAKSGKQAIGDYYLTHIKKSSSDKGDYRVGTGRKVSYAFVVRAHARKTKSGKRIWIQEHFRGVDHLESDKERIYRVG